MSDSTILESLSLSAGICLITGIHGGVTGLLLLLLALRFVASVCWVRLLPVWRSLTLEDVAVVVVGPTHPLTWYSTVAYGLAQAPALRQQWSLQACLPHAPYVT